MVGLYATERCILVHLVVGDFGRVGSLRHCWEGLVVDRLPVVGYCLKLLGRLFLACPY